MNSENVNTEKGFIRDETENIFYEEYDKLTRGMKIVDEEKKE